MKKRNFAFLVLFLILIAGCVSAQTTPNSIPPIEETKEELLYLKKETEIIKQSVEELKNKTNQVCNEVNKKLTRNKEICDLAERNLTWPSMGINIIILFIGVFTIGVTVLGFYCGAKAKEFRTDIKDSLAIARNTTAVDLFKKNNFEEALREGEKALKDAILAHGENPTVLEKKTFLSMLKSNLAYYWVAANKVQNRDIALQYAEEGLKIGKIAFVDNFLYIFMKLAKTKEEKARWKEIYSAYKADIERYYNPPQLQVTPISEIKQYEQFYEEIERV